jgi:hypothetical protein
MIFKKGSKYSRKDIGWILLPDSGRPAGGDWDTGYVRIENKLIIFMNIGVPGTTDHDFNNFYDDSNKTIVWYGKPKSHSQQPTMQKLLKRELIPYFFARWDNKDPMFTFLGIGKIISFKDGAQCLDSSKNQVDTIEFKIVIEDSDQIIPLKNRINITDESDHSNFNTQSSFALEKHLESFIIKNWASTILNKQYDIYKENNKLAVQYSTRSGPLDILAISKDKKEFLVIELKKGRASDEVLGQLQRYMGHIKNNTAKNNESVSGLIIALDDDKNLKDALSVTNNIKFMKYKISFDLVN